MFVKTILIIILILYGLALLFIFLYSIAQASLVYNYLKFKKPQNILNALPYNLPVVTIQLPVYNERYVIERLIDTIAKINYPSDKLEIQVLDDSTDETLEIITKKVEEWQQKGIDIKQVKRTDRKGFKAGALEEGLRVAKGEFIAIFDADFLPTEDFIQQTIFSFSDPKVGMVQTKWEHINRDYSLLTELQAFGLDAHFTVEQVGRNKGGCFINFNGTGGIWRKACILDAGNWQADTLTEDLDLSYRAQLKGWEFIYLENVGSPAELPPVMSALKSQQYRWTKGGAETAVKHLGTVLRSDKSFFVKWHALFHLLNSGIFISLITCAVLSVPLLFVKQQFPDLKKLFLLASFFLLSFLILGVLYWISASKRVLHIRNPTLYFFRTFFLFLSVSMGLSLHNAIAVLEGYFGKKTPFVRTPKFNIATKKDNWKANTYISSGINMITIAEGLLSVFFTLAIFKGFQIEEYGLLPFHLMLAFGFATVFYLSVFQHKFST
ncbi:MAG: glycosyltransferase [Bacteroidetes bacterium]|nr:glycosyltransferase [Bacteroidota bacterium]